MTRRIKALLLAVLMIATTVFVNVPSAHVDAAVTPGVNVSMAEVQQNGEFTVNVVLPAIEKTCFEVMAKVHFNKNVFELTAINAEAPADTMLDMSDNLKLANEKGTFSFAIISLGDGFALKNGYTATATFRARAAALVGTYQYEVEEVIAYDDDYNVLYEVPAGTKTAVTVVAVPVGCQHDIKTYEAKVPNCKESGWDAYGQCTKCSQFFSADGKEIDAKPEKPVDVNAHTYDAGKVTTPATCQKEGVKTYTCTVCKGTKTEVIKKTTTHSYSKDFTVDKAASCTVEGSKSKHCTVAGCTAKTEVTVIAKTAHTYDAGKITTAATCEKDGIKTFTCTVCKGTKTETVVKTGHKSVTDKAVPATCTKEGLTEGSHCSVCNKVLVKQNPVAKTAHSYTETSIHGAVEEKAYKCKVCGDSYKVTVEGYRIAGSNRFDTSIQSAEAMKANMGIDKFDTVVLASGLNFADALSGSYLATVKNAPILLVNTFDLPGFQKYVKENVKPGGTIYVLGGTSAVSEKSIEAFKGGFNVKRLGGADRFATNLLVLKEAGVKGKDLLICTGVNFADSLSASAANQPLLLVYGKSLFANQKDFLNTFTGKKYIIGGTGAVSTEIEKQIGNCERLAGANRFNTSVLIAKKFFGTPKAAVFASAMNFPDGLCAGPLAYQLGAPLLLTTEKWEADAKGYVAEKNIKIGVALGGQSALSDKAIKTILGKTLKEYK